MIILLVQADVYGNKEAGVVAVCIIVLLNILYLGEGVLIGLAEPDIVRGEDLRLLYVEVCSFADSGIHLKEKRIIDILGHRVSVL